MALEAPPQTKPTAFDDSAGGLLEKAFHHFNREEHAQATRTFHDAIATNNLNDAGRALAYWHIYLSQKRLGHVDRSAEALNSFAIVAEEVLEVRNEVKYAVNTSGDFVERFNLPARLSRARAILSATWAARMPDFGRSPELAVPTFSQSEADYFIELAPPCADSDERQIDRQQLVLGKKAVQHVTLFCEGQRQGTEYYIEVMNR